MPHQGARERELHRYYQPWLDTFISTLDETPIFPPPGPPGSHQPRSSRDKALTAFAQLGCLRLNAKRGVVTLIDSERQYILAEATKSLSLLNDAQHAPGDELWFGNSFVSRAQGVSQDAMYPETCTVNGPDGSNFSAPALIINDIAQDPVYQTRGYAGAGVSFYCGVPLKTRLGHVIGVYNVTDDKPRDGLSPDELRFMVDMAIIVVEHLEVVKNDRARARGDRLIHGIGTFIEGQATNSDHDPEEMLVHSPAADVLVSNDKQVRSTPTSMSRPWASQEVVPTFKGLMIGDANLPQNDNERSPPGRPSSRPPHHRVNSHGVLQTRRASVPSSDATHPHHQQHLGSKKPSANSQEKALTDYNQVFDRAAAILRYCLAAEGVAFLDASSANLSSGSTVADDTTSHPTVRHSRGRPRPSLPHPGDATRREKAPESETTTETTSHDSSDSTSITIDARPSNTPARPRKGSKKCDVLGRSGKHSATEIPEHLFRRFVRRHPEGKCFTFDEDGNLASSDEGSESASVAADAATDSSKSTQHPPPFPYRSNALLKHFLVPEIL
jgi:hypothetical protein